MSFGYNSSGNAPPNPWLKILVPKAQNPQDEPVSNPFNKVLFCDYGDVVQYRINNAQRLITKAEQDPEFAEAAGRAAIMLEGDLVVHFLTGQIK